MTCGEQAGLALGGASCARQGSDRGRQPDEIKPFTLERLRRAIEPVVDRPLGATLKRNLDQSRIAAMKAAQEMHRIGEIAAGMRPPTVEQAEEIGMAAGASAGDSGKLRSG